MLSLLVHYFRFDRGRTGSKRSLPSRRWKLNMWLVSGSTASLAAGCTRLGEFAEEAADVCPTECQGDLAAADELTGTGIAVNL